MDNEFARALTEVMARAEDMQMSLQENTAALVQMSQVLVRQNEYLHLRIHDLAEMVAVVQGAVGLLWERSGFEAEIGPLEFHGLRPLEPPPTAES